MALSLEGASRGLTLHALCGEGCVLSLAYLAFYILFVTQPHNRHMAMCLVIWSFPWVRHIRCLSYLNRTGPHMMSPKCSFSQPIKVRWDTTTWVSPYHLYDKACTRKPCMFGLLHAILGAAIMEPHVSCLCGQFIRSSFRQALSRVPDIFGEWNVFMLLKWQGHLHFPCR